MAETIDEITINYEDNGKLLVEELDKAILTRGAWSTIVFKFRDRSANAEDWSVTKFTIRRYQKRNGVFRQQSKFNISNAQQAKQLRDILDAWIADED